MNGLFGIYQAMSAKHPGDLFNVINLILHVVTILVGLGLILRVELARGIVNALCFLQILQGVFGLLGSFIFTFVVPLFGAIAMIFSFVQIALAILMIFLIGETESRAANF